MLEFLQSFSGDQLRPSSAAWVVARLGTSHTRAIKKTPGVQPEGFQISQAVVTPDQVNSDDLVIAALPAWVPEESSNDFSRYAGRDGSYNPCRAGGCTRVTL